MPATAVNFGRWLERLGIKRQDQPEILHAVQPVLIVGDQSSLVSPIVGPSAVVGGQETPANFACFEILSIAPGGTLVEMTVGTAGTAFVTFTYQAAQRTLTSVSLPNAYNANPDDPIQAASRIGNDAALIPSNDNPVVQQGSLDVHTALMFVPPGNYFYCQGSTAGSRCSFMATITEFPAPNAQ